jgi:hypothetical protein
MNTQVPILFILFNRLDTTTRVFEEIKKAKPSKLYLFADGPRKGKQGEAELCEKVRAIKEKVDWPCNLKVNFKDENLGAKYAIGYAVNWMFESEEYGIVLEHDCLPHPDFFKFCEDVLERYKDNEKIMHVTGNNYLYGRIQIKDSYYFSRLSNPTWGWATWKRAWKFYDADIKNYPEFLKSNGFKQVIKSNRLRRFYKNIYSDLYKGLINTWDYQWSLIIWSRKGICITPCVNLVSNIGFGEGAMHTFDPNHHFANIPSKDLGTIIHPSQIKVNEVADNFVLQKIIHPPFIKRVRLLKRFFRITHQETTNDVK